MSDQFAVTARERIAERRMREEFQAALRKIDAIDIALTYMK